MILLKFNHYKGNKSIREKLNLVARRFLNASETGAQECVYNLLSMQVSRCSRDVVFINTFPKCDRFSILRDDDNLKMSKDGDPIFNLTSIDHYIGRDKSDLMQHLCLAEFVATYDYLTKSAKKAREAKIKGRRFFNSEDEDDDENSELNVDRDSQGETTPSQQNDPLANTQQSTSSSEDKPIYHEIQYLDPATEDTNLVGYVVKRKAKERIIRYCRYNKDDTANFLREQLMLWLPWRDEQKELIDNAGRHLQIFLDNATIIKANRQKYEHKSTAEFERIFEEIEEQDKIEKEAQELVENVEIAESRHQAEGDNEANQEHFEQDIQNGDLMEDEESASAAERRETAIGFQNYTDVYDADDWDQRLTVQELREINQEADAYMELMNDPDQSRAEYDELVDNLNTGQQQVHLNLLNCVKAKEPVHLFVSGQGGTGKSRLIKACAITLNRYLNSDAKKRDPEYTYKNRVLIIAAQGTAAFLIKGKTIHSALHLALCDSGTDTADALNASASDRSEFAHIDVVIIDEISLVSTRMFQRVEQRLRDFKTPSEVFGGASMIVFGELWQLPPVFGGFIFNAPPSAYNDLLVKPSNPLWEMFRFFELTEIMRQREDFEFATAIGVLGRKGVLGLSKEQLEMFDSRIVDDSSIPQDAVILFRTNEKRHIFNKVRIAQKPGLEFTQIARDVASGEGAHEWAAIEFLKRLQKDTIRETDEIKLPNKIILKPDCKYMISGNMNVADGLVNGSTGKLRKIIYGDESVQILPPTREERPEIPRFETKCFAIRLWMEYSDQSVGVKQRRELNAYRHADGITNQAWVPICRQTLLVKETNGNLHTHPYRIERTQFKMTEAEAITIHKSQGATLETVAVFLGKESKPLCQAGLYVAVSRCTKLDGLSLFGSASILPRQYRGMTDAQKQAVLKKRMNSSQVAKEYKRLAQFPMINKWYFTCKDYLTRANERRPLKSRLTCMFQNVRSFKKHAVKIGSDIGFRAADILLLSECRTHPSQQIALPDYTRIHLTTCSLHNHAFGQICFVRTEKAALVKFIGDNANHGNLFNSTKIVELSLFECKLDSAMTETFHICHIYKHPSMPKKEFKIALRDFLLMHKLLVLSTESNNSQEKYMFKRKIFFLGDFNINYVDKENNHFVDRFFLKYGLSMLIDTKKYPSTTDNNTLLDWCLSNNRTSDNRPDTIEAESLVYESFYSDHKPLWLEIKQK